MPTDDEGDDDAVGRVPPPPPDDRLWRHPSEVSAFGAGPAPIPIAPAAAPSRSPAVWPIASVAALVGAALCAGVLALTGNLSVEGDPAVERVKVSPMPPSHLFADESTVRALTTTVRPSVVRLHITRPEGSTQACGTVLRDDGVVVTSAREVARATEVVVVLDDGRHVTGHLVGVDLPSDVGVITIDAGRLTAATLGSTEDLHTGMATMAIAATDKGEPAVSTGVVSTLGERLDTGDGSLHGLIRTDAPIATGWSGGPLVDGTGAVIGITTDLAGDRTRFGYATPIEVVRRFAEELLRSGKVAHGWLGIEGADVSDRQAVAMGARAGAVVTRVVPGSPAAAAGLRIDDVITELAGERVRTSSDLVVALRAHKPGDVVTIGYWRDGEHHATEVTIEHHPEG